MCTFNDRFIEYKTLVLRCIKSCQNQLQLLCAGDMIDHFENLFKMSIPHKELEEALFELQEAHKTRTVQNHFQ
jgi:hypothetical protein